VGWKARNEVEERIRVLEFGSSSNVSVSFFIYYILRLDKIILAEQTSDGPGWACYPPTRKSYHVWRRLWMGARSILGVDSNGMLGRSHLRILLTFLLFPLSYFSPPLTILFLLSLPIVCHAFMAKTNQFWDVAIGTQLLFSLSFSLHWVLLSVYVDPCSALCSRICLSSWRQLLIRCCFFSLIPPEPFLS
jgi:hypothetical protein